MQRQSAKEAPMHLSHIALIACASSACAAPASTVVSPNHLSVASESREARRDEHAADRLERLGPAEATVRTCGIANAPGTVDFCVPEPFLSRATASDWELARQEREAAKRRQDVAL